MTTDGRTVTRLAARELWRGIAAAVLGLAAMLEVVVSSYDAAFSNGMTGSLRSLVDNPALRALYGTAYDLHSAGGFGVWRGGAFVLVVAALWAALASVRVLRGEEEAGRWDLLLAQPLRARGVVVRHLVVLLAGCVAIGLAVTAVFVVNGEAADGALLFGAGVGLLAAGAVGLGACAAQLFGQRRRAAGVAGGLVGFAFVVRMLSDADESLGWLRWCTPFGWVEELRAFADNRLLPLVPLLVLPAGLLVAAVVLFDRRDLGAGLIADRQHVAARTRLLGGLGPFAWRERLGAAAGWSGGLAVYGFIIGAITATFTDFIRDNAEFRRLTQRYDIGNLSTPRDLIGFMAGVLGLLLVLQATTSLHRSWEDERDGRLEMLHALPMTRTAWFGWEISASAATVVCSGTAAALAMWLGAAVGGADLALVDTLGAVANTACLVVLFTGLAVALHGLAPRVALGVTAGLAVVGYFLAVLGPAANLPEAIVTLSPFQHLAHVPADPVDTLATSVMVVAGLALGAVGMGAFARRDLVN